MDLSKIVIPEGLEPKPIVTCVIEGALDEEDLRELALSCDMATEPVEGDDPADLKKIREKHHSVARMIASGLSQRMVSQLCGYSESYLSVLLNNPSMQELISLYRIQFGAAAAVITEKLRTIGMEAIESLAADLAKGDLSKQEKIQLAKLGLDRSDHGPTSTRHNVNENHSIDHAELKRLNNEALSRSASHIVPSSEVRKALAPPVEQHDEADRDMGPEESGLPEDRQQQRLP